ncbi:TonB-dependent receptor [Zhongshania sp.]|uniref:TonB-dependent receptor n=1 Tax=Zhongshania sp. TaxID=1971902 RepID=UPI0035646011
MINNTKSCLSVAILTALVLPNIAQAALEEVIVTAQKREQNLQDVPMAITALGRELLEDNEVTNLQDLTKLVPSLSMTSTDNPATSSVRVRGVGTSVFSAAVEPNVSMVVDEVPLANNGLASFEFLDLERIEVLRGPQGTLFGKNSTAGLVHIISRDPAQEFEAVARLTHEKPDNFPGSLTKYQFSGSGPLTDNLGLRVSAFYKDDKGFYEDVEQNDTGPDLIVYGMRSKLRWEATDRLLAKFSIDYQEQDGASTPVAFRSANPDKAEKSPEINYGEENRQVKTFGNNKANTTNLGGSLFFNYDLGDSSFTSITGFRDFELDAGTGIPDFEGDRIDVDLVGTYRRIETLSQEFRLSSNELQELEYTVGLLLFNNKVNERLYGSLSDIPPDIIVRGVIPAFPVVPFPVTPGSFGQTQNTFNFVEVDNAGLYGQLTWHMRDDLHLTVGGRYIYEKMSASEDRNEAVVNDDTGQEVSSTHIDIPLTSFSDTAVIGTTSMSYDWTEDSIIYGTISTGYRGGAFDLNATQLEEAFQNPVDPEKAFNMELGIKSRLFDNKLEINVALFRTVFEDFQAQIIKLGSASGQLVALSSSQLENAGEMEAKGVEIEFQSQPIDSLFLNGSLLYSDNTFNEFTTQCFVGQEPGEAGGVDEDGNGTCDSQDLAGAPLAYSPKLGVSVGARYEMVFDKSRTYLAVNGRWQDDVQFTNEQSPTTIQEAYAIWNMRLGWVDMEHNIEIAGYINNLFAQSYTTNMRPLSVSNDRRDVSHFLNRDADRVFGISLSYDL